MHAQTWLEHAIVHILASGLTTSSCVMDSLKASRYFSMCPSSVLLQLDSVSPDSPFFRQCTPNMLGIAHASYSEFTTRYLPLMTVTPYSMKMHLHSSPLWSQLHSAKGVLSLTFATLQMLLTIFSMRLSPNVVFAFMNTPESSIANRFAGLFRYPRRQLFHRCTPIPPADPPVSTTLLAVFSPYLRLIQSKCDRVMAAPRKYSSVSLYLTGGAQPWWSAPSQYPRMNLVQLANLLIDGSDDRQPSPANCSGQYLELPNSVLLRWQQLSRVLASVSSPHSPPPSIKIRMLLVSPPSWTQSRPGDPSMHLASGSKLWMTLRQRGSATARVTNSRRRMDIIQRYIIDECHILKRVGIWWLRGNGGFDGVGQGQLGEG